MQFSKGNETAAVPILRQSRYKKFLIYYSITITTNVLLKRNRHVKLYLAEIIPQHDSVTFIAGITPAGSPPPASLLLPMQSPATLKAPSPGPRLRRSVRTQ